MGHSSFDPVDQGPAWNTGRKLGAKRPLKPKEIWAIRFLLDQGRRLRDRALFDLAIDSKLRGCDLVKIRIGDLVAGGRVRNRTMVSQKKTKRPVQFELLEPARSSILAWLERRSGTLDDFAFPVGLIGLTISAPDNMPGWSMNGSAELAFAEKTTGRTRSDALRLH